MTFWLIFALVCVVMFWYGLEFSETSGRTLLRRILKASRYAGVIVLFVLAGFLAILLHGWALSVLWGWFVVPIFKVPQLTIPLAIGIVTTVQLVVRQDYSAAIALYRDAPVGDSVARFVSDALLGPVSAVGFGWVVTQFL
jgi:hypothetical protein